MTAAQQLLLLHLERAEVLSRVGGGPLVAARLAFRLGEPELARALLARTGGLFDLEESQRLLNDPCPEALLVQAGRAVTDPRREGFDTAASIWRPTRQVALGLWRGQPTIAYLESGTPEAFAAALVQAGLSDALRLDSGSSATAYSTSGYGDLGGYLNTVWSRPVPNAIVFVPKVTGGGAVRVPQASPTVSN